MTFHATPAAHSLLTGSPEEINQQLTAIVDSVYDGLYITDGNADTILINKTYQTISGLSPEDVLGKNMREMVAAGMIDQSGSLIALETGTIVTLEQTFHNGTQALITSTPYFNEQGEISMVITVVRDMTELYELQEKYRESEERRQAEMRFFHRQQEAPSGLIAEDPLTLETLQQAKKVAALDATVLLQGETGVGKEQLARFIYEHSSRADQSFISINCGAIPPSLIESELFGYERGAFTGANKEGKMGIFESAHHGTVFLDEIGDLPLDLQVHLLRVLQEMQVKRVGGVRAIPVDVRIIAATNRNLAEMVRNKTFREDLYYRLCVVPINLPPLRERKGDIRPLVYAFMDEMNKKYGLKKSFTAPAMDCMQQYGWPGNVRELKNVVEQAVILSNGSNILPSDLPIPHFSDVSFEESQPDQIDLKRKVAEFEYQYMLKAYKKYGNVRAAAASLGMNDATFVRKRQRYAAMLQK